MSPTTPRRPAGDVVVEDDGAQEADRAKDADVEQLLSRRRARRTRKDGSEG